jgi:DNA-directed RNA polymerases I, II, and III subunit RPABC5
MIIPVRCLTCGKVLGDLYQAYQREIKKETSTSDTINMSTKKIEKTHRGKVMDKLKLKRYCCRRHMLSHVDLIDII